MEQWLNAACHGFALAGTAWVATRVRAIPAASRCRIWIAALVGLALLLAVAAGQALRTSGAAADAVVRGAGAASGRVAAPVREPIVRVPAVARSWPIVAIWALGFAWRVGVLGRAVARIRRARRSVVPFPADRAAALRWWRDGSEGRAALAVDGRARCAAMLGFGRPIVAVPAPWLSRFADEELDAILLHELAHARRRDDLVEFAGQMVVAACWFHPAAWWIARQIEFEREAACDEEAARVATVRGYASSLVKAGEVLRQASPLPTPRLAASTLARPGLLARRVELLLRAAGHRRGRVGRGVAAAAFLGIAAIVVEGRSLPPVFGGPVTQVADAARASAVAIGAGGAGGSADARTECDRPSSVSNPRARRGVRRTAAGGLASSPGPGILGVNASRQSPTRLAHEAVDAEASAGPALLRSRPFGQLPEVAARVGSGPADRSSVAGRAAPARSLAVSLTAAGKRTGGWFSRAGAAIAGGVTAH